MTTILLIEDMKGVRDSVEAILNVAGHNVILAENGADGLQKLESSSVDVVITDILMPEMDGNEVIIAMKKTHPNVPIIAISAGNNKVSADAALMMAADQADRSLQKPFSREELLAAINELIGS